MLKLARHSKPSGQSQCGYYTVAITGFALCFLIFHRLRDLLTLKPQSEEVLRRRERPVHHSHEVSLDDKLLFGTTLASELLNLIHQRYEFDNFKHFQFFLISWNIPTHGWDILKYKFAIKILSNSFDSTFLMLFSGTSVTAGYDNEYNQSYPHLIDKKLRPIFDALGVKLIVRNIAQYQVNCKLSNYCMEAMGGSNADFIGWENSFSCGRALDSIELAARIAYWNKAVIHYSASGSFTMGNNNCKPSQDPMPWIHDTWTPTSVGITSHYNVTKETIAMYRELQNKWYTDGGSVSRFIKTIQEEYKGVAPHGFNVYAKSNKPCVLHDNNIIVNKTHTVTGTNMLSSAQQRKLQLNNGNIHNKMTNKAQQIKSKSKDKTTSEGCEALAVLGKCHDQGGPHWLTAETGYYGNKQIVGKSIHPPIGQHLLRAELLIYNYLHILLDAGSMLREDVLQDGMREDDAIAKYQHILSTLQTPIHTQPIHCTSTECLYKPQCYTNFKPHYNPSQLLTTIIIPNNGDGSSGDWSLVMKPPIDRHTGYGYLDDKYYLQAVGMNKELHLRITNVRANTIYLYSKSNLESLKDALFYLDVNVEFTSSKVTSGRSSSSGGGTNNAHGSVGSRGEVYKATKTRYLLHNITYIPTDEYIILHDIPLTIQHSTISSNNSNTHSNSNIGHILTIITQPQEGIPEQYVNTLTHIVVF